MGCTSSKPTSPDMRSQKPPGKPHHGKMSDCGDDGPVPQGGPKYPDFPLLPAALAITGPTDKGKNLLVQVCDKAVKDGDFSITRSPIQCPAGKNEFLALKPYFWETEPGSGRWERRDGQRNPLAAKPTCQKELMGLAKAVSALAAGGKHVDPKYIATAEAYLKVFFLDPETRMTPDVTYAQCCLGDHPLVGDKTFVVATRHLTLVDQALAIMPDSEVTLGVKEWVQQQAHWMESSKQGADALASGNNITMWYQGIYGSHVGLLDPASGANYARSVLDAYMARGSPQAVLGEELQRTKPRHYVLFALEPLFLLGGIAGGAGPCGGIQGATAPAQEHQLFLAGLLDFARGVPAGKLDTDNDARHAAKVAWFQRVLDRWAGREVCDEDPDGRAWEGGWNQPARLRWYLI